MQITRESIKQEIDQLSEIQLKQIAKFIELIKFPSPFHTRINNLNQFAHLYQEFAQEDRDLAEVGIAEYATQLQQEDQA